MENLVEKLTNKIIEEQKKIDDTRKQKETESTYKIVVGHFQLYIALDYTSPTDMSQLEPQFRYRSEVLPYCEKKYSWRVYLTDKNTGLEVYSDKLAESDAIRLFQYSKVILKTGKIDCPKCDGRGTIRVENKICRRWRSPIIQTSNKQCPKCDGKGLINTCSELWR